MMWLNMAENCLKELILFHIFLAIVQKSTRYDANQHIRCLPTLHIFLTAKQLQKSTTTQQDIENCRKKTVLAHSFWRESQKKDNATHFFVNKITQDTVTNFHIRLNVSFVVAMVYHCS